MINITNVKITKVEENMRVKGIATITIDDSFVIHDIKIMQGDKGIFVAMPSRKLPNGEYKDIAHPINTEVREIIQKAFLNEYNK